MADFACDRNAKALELKAGRKVLETPTDPKHSDAVEEHRTMSCWTYNIPSGGFRPEQSEKALAIIGWLSDGYSTAETSRFEGVPLEVVEAVRGQARSEGWI